ncbi:hypothetical protein [Gaopeijia maritima]|uniref:Uncharacterized protein n=1 Tax=Gaopeijia maritima TaxID=3119007 RepID=A0ABU9EBB3_9BACT
MESTQLLTDSIHIFAAGLSPDRTWVLAGHPARKRIGIIGSSGRFVPDAKVAEGPWVSISGHVGGWSAVGAQEIAKREWDEVQTSRLPVKLLVGATTANYVAGFTAPDSDLVLIDLSRGKVVGETAVPFGTIQALSEGHFVVAQFEPPYSVTVVDTLGHGTSVTPEIPSEHLDSAGHWRTASVLPLDCGGLLQIIADLRSDRRISILYRAVGTTIAFVRARPQLFPGSFVASEASERSLLAALDQGGERALSHYTWSWE